MNCIKSKQIKTIAQEEHMPQLCMCGSPAGQAHDKRCPYPYYGNDTKEESKWMDAWRKLRDQLINTQPMPKHDITDDLLLTE